jgi:hypothetical protein
VHQLLLLPLPILLLLQQCASQGCPLALLHAPLHPLLLLLLLLLGPREALGGHAAGPRQAP